MSKLSKRKGSSSTTFPPQKSGAGFTMIEILVVTAIFLILAGIGLFMTLDAFRGYLHRSERDTIVSTLAKARSEAMANICIGPTCADGKPHGVCYSAPDYIIFQGSSYNAAEATNQTIPGNPAIGITSDHTSFFTCGTGTGAVFDQLTGKLLPQISPATDELKITISETGRPDEFIYINNEGRIAW